MSTKFNKLEEAFDLPSMHEVSETTCEDIQAALEQAKDLEKTFDQIDGYDQHDIEMDELATLAIQAHKDLQDLGMNVEVRHAGEIFSSSSQMLKIAVDAKNNKVEKKLKLLRLQLEKMKLDRATSNDKTVEGTAVTLDRNEILKQLRQMGGNDK
jgi:hypothetical protein